MKGNPRGAGTDLYLGIETSCDDTSCAVFSPRRGVIASRTAAQLDHARYGGVVPEIASRTHMRALLPVYETVMEEAGAGLGELAGIGVTNGPGLTGSLLVGLSFAKALAYGGGVPLVGVGPDQHVGAGHGPHPPGRGGVADGRRPPGHGLQQPRRFGHGDGRGAGHGRRHQVVGQTIPLGLVPHVQARLLARYLRGDTEAYTPFLYR